MVSAPKGGWAFLMSPPLSEILGLSFDSMGGHCLYGEYPKERLGLSHALCRLVCA